MADETKEQPQRPIVEETSEEDTAGIAQEVAKGAVNKRVKTPTLLQMDALECGAASLGMILQYYGKYIPLETLREECGVSRDGSKAKNILKAARKYGMRAEGYRKDPENLADLDFPLIIFWEFNHFVVLEGFKNGKAYLNDPASGPRTITIEEFDESFTGIALKLTPDEDFKKGGSKPSIIKSLKKRAQGSIPAWIYVFLAGLGLVVPGLVVPTYFKIFVDEVLIGRNTDIVIPVLFAMGVTVVISATLSWLQGYILLLLQTKIAITQASSFFWHVLRLPIKFFSQRFGGEVGSRVMINDQVASLLSGPLSNAFLSAFMVIFYAVLMIQYNVALTIIAVFFSALNILALKYISRKRVDLNQRMMQDSGKMMGTSMNGLQMIETLKAMGSESEFFSQWSGHQAKIVNASQTLGTYTSILNTVPTVLTAINSAIVLLVGGLSIMNGKMTMGMFLAFQTLLRGFTTPINNLVNVGAMFQDAIAGINRLDDVLNYPTEEDIKKEISATIHIPDRSKLTGHVEIKNLTFGYNLLEPPLISDFSLSLAPGSRVALVGMSGSGKSTISRIICGLFAPWEGEILFDGKTRHEIPRPIMTNSLSLVDQDIFLYEGSIKENIAMWNPLIADKEIIAAARDACIHDVIISRPGGYGGHLSENGKNYSGGQRQRLEIARALATNPSLIVLDEATSALDATTEALIDKNIRRRGCTAIIVAHRLSTIRDCDEIIVLQLGKVVERGTHEQLLKSGGYYSQLIQMT